MRRVLVQRPPARLLAALVVGCLALAASTSAASATITAAPEPVFTKTAGNNHFYFTVEKPTYYSEYRACIVTTKVVPGGEQILEGAFGGPGVSGSLCTANLPAGTKAFNEVVYTESWIPPDGGTYRVCLAAYHNTGGVIWQTEPQANGQYVICPTSTIDRSKPSIGVHLAADAARVNTLSVPVRIDYQDAISPPWQGPNGTASNWVCAAAYPSQCNPTEVSSVCSVPAVPNDMGHYPANLANTFSCTLNVPGEGRYTVCAISADSAVPDSPTIAWNGTASSTTANLSAPACDDVTVDTTGPAVTVTADAANLTTGQLVRFGATATDPAGTSGSYDWDFGDNSAHGSGPAPTHTYTQAGTFVVRATTADAVGNGGSATLTIKVGAAGGTGGGAKGEGGGKESGGAPLPGTGAGTWTPPGSPALDSGQVKAGGAATAVAPLSPAAISQAGGGGGSRSATLGKLRIMAPRSFRSGLRLLKVNVTFGRAGSLRLTLMKGAARISRGTMVATRPGTAGLALRVPKTLAPGAYKLEATFRPGGGKALTKSLPLTVVRAAARPSASSSSTSVPLGLVTQPATD
ncbi:MAG: PKD domain-containing protein [Actinobacteria bacterium]|nr:PKD domain-containing protein [Actinomycetota bacterium]